MEPKMNAQFDKKLAEGNSQGLVNLLLGGNAAPLMGPGFANSHHEKNVKEGEGRRGRFGQRLDVHKEETIQSPFDKAQAWGIIQRIKQEADPASMGGEDVDWGDINGEDVVLTKAGYGSDSNGPFVELLVKIRYNG